MDKYYDKISTAVCAAVIMVGMAAAVSVLTRGEAILRVGLAPTITQPASSSKMIGFVFNEYSIQIMEAPQACPK